jgi:hypothetical protein
MNKQPLMTPEQSFFAVFCIEALADELHIPGNKVYGLLTEKSDILDSYIVPSYDMLHTQSKGYIVRELKELMQKRGVLSGAEVFT